MPLKTFFAPKMFKSSRIFVSKKGVPLRVIVYCPSTKCFATSPSTRYPGDLVFNDCKIQDVTNYNNHKVYKLTDSSGQLLGEKKKIFHHSKLLLHKVKVITSPTITQSACTSTNLYLPPQLLAQLQGQLPLPH